jgi:hypothetical protein
MTNLSPAAVAVLRAAGDSEPGIYATIAAALRVTADQVVPVELHPQVYEDCCQYSDVQTRAGIRHQLLVIAAELEQ